MSEGHLPVPDDADDAKAAAANEAHNAPGPRE